jgi:hypothetical protein
MQCSLDGEAAPEAAAGRVRRSSYLFCQTVTSSLRRVETVIQTKQRAFVGRDSKCNRLRPAVGEIS